MNLFEQIANALDRYLILRSRLEALLQVHETLAAAVRPLPRAFDSIEEFNAFMEERGSVGDSIARASDEASQVRQRLAECEGDLLQLIPCWNVWFRVAWGTPTQKRWVSKYSPHADRVGGSLSIRETEPDCFPSGKPYD